ncbi:hypothetical protein [Bradyrhizobium genosp. P]|uniref:hypothetical protein n=1 Tax=Bradyrhizobium genosp. P TaxID=83641 RepID=UPI003CF100AF
MARASTIAARNQTCHSCTDPLGLTELRASLARRNSAETDQLWSADETAVMRGNPTMAPLNPAGDVLIPAPCWTAILGQIVVAVGKPVLIATWHIDFVLRNQSRHHLGDTRARRLSTVSELDDLQRSANGLSTDDVASALLMHANVAIVFGYIFSRPAGVRLSYAAISNCSHEPSGA